MPFSHLRLSPPILRALKQEGYTTPTPIQQQAIPHAMNGRDLLGCAQTGTGKTAAFALPIIQRLSAAHHAPDNGHRAGGGRDTGRKARALILAPTRELAVQIAQSFATYGAGSGLEHTVIYGGVSQFHQEKALRRGVDIIVATPGRLLDLMQQRLCDLSHVQVLVLDEADRMLDMGFIDPIRRITAATPPPPKRQTMLFSATMPKPIMALANSLLRDPVRVAVDPVSSAVPLIEQGVYMVDRHGKQALLEHLLNEPGGPITRALIFTRTKHGADKVGKKLLHAGIRAETIHGNKSQPQRRRALERFSTGQARVLVATDVAARGLDVDHISHVFNFDLPMEPEAYIHRIGRTGRAGATGVALSFCDHQERDLLHQIERLIGKRVEVRKAVGVKPESQPMHTPHPVPARPPHHSPSRPPHPRSSHASPRSDRPSGPSGHAAFKPHARPQHPTPKSNDRSGHPSSHPSQKRSMRGWNKPTNRRTSR